MIILGLRRPLEYLELFQTRLEFLVLSGGGLLIIIIWHFTYVETQNLNGQIVSFNTEMENGADLNVPHIFRHL